MTSKILPLMSLVCVFLEWQLHGQSLTLDRLELHNVRAQRVDHQDRPAIKITDADSSGRDDVNRVAIVSGTSLQDGKIDVQLAGDTAPEAAPNLRGFVGIAFRVASNASRYECIYLRPKNGRSQDQAQRNHSTQYISVPGFPWQKLRSESPGKYESYVDLVPGRWTHVRIQLEGVHARLYVDDASEPTLIVNDLKQTPIEGAVALWIGPGTIAQFADLKVSR